MKSLSIFLQPLANNTNSTIHNVLNPFTAFAPCDDQHELIVFGSVKDKARATRFSLQEPRFIGLLEWWSDGSVA
jgi:hypothetical protein